MRHLTITKSLLTDVQGSDDPYLNYIHHLAQSWLSDTPTFQLTTSGSTGTPKSIQVKRAQIKASIQATAKALQLSEGVRSLACINARFVGGMMMIFRTLELNGTLTVVEPSGDPLRQVPDDLHFDFTALVPLQLESMVQKHGALGVNRLGKILLGGAPVSESLLQIIKTLQTPVYHSYGMTETVSHVALRQLNGTDGWDPAFTVLDGVKFGLDERGCLWLSGEVTDGDLVQTNDLVSIETARSFRWLGRIDHVINSGGLKINPEQIERSVGRVMYDLNYQADFFVWHEPDERLGQKIVLILCNKDENWDERKFLKALAQILSSYEMPKSIYFVDSFEKTDSGKTDCARTARRIFSRTQ